LAAIIANFEQLEFLQIIVPRTISYGAAMAKYRAGDKSKDEAKTDELKGIHHYYSTEGVSLEEEKEAALKETHPENMEIDSQNTSKNM
jgi:hypothetical protein